MFNFVTKDYINKINDFLENEKIFMPSLFSIDQSASEFLRMAKEKEFAPNVLSREIVSFSLNLLSKDRVREGKFNDGYNEFRDFNSELLYVYNGAASLKWDFHIGNFGIQNDNMETLWFREYTAAINGGILPFISEAINLRRSNKVLLKCSTTSLVNEEYMFGNYTFTAGDYCAPAKWQQKRIAYNKKDVNDLFDRTYAYTKYIPLRGFVRYDSHGKGDSIKWLSELSAISSTSLVIKKAVEFASIVLSYFVKGACMAVEGEYRHIIINEAALSSLDLNVKPESLGVGSFNESLLKSLINQQYKKSCSSIDFSCERDGQEWNIFYRNDE